MRKAFFIITGVLLLVGPAVPALAQADYEAQVRANCQSLLSSLDELQRRDLVARINRGRSYQETLDQMQALDTRIRNNNLDASRFDVLHTRVNTTVEAFRTAYFHYDDLMNSLQSINCNDKPGDFANSLNQVRAARQAVGEDVTNIETALADYRAQVASLRDDLQRVESKQ